MAQAKATFTVGREASAQYGETLAGVRPKDPKHQFDFPVAALDASGQPSPHVQLTPRGAIGAGDAKVATNPKQMATSHATARRKADSK